MDNVFEKIERYKIVPVVTVRTTADAKDMLEGLLEGGLPVAEICFRTECAEDAIQLAVKKYPEMRCIGKPHSYVKSEVLRVEKILKAKYDHRFVQPQMER